MYLGLNSSPFLQVLQNLLHAVLHVLVDRSGKWVSTVILHIVDTDLVQFWCLLNFLNLLSQQDIEKETEIFGSAGHWTGGQEIG